MARTPGPLYFCRDRTPDFVWRLRQKECTKSYKLTLKIAFFSPLLRGHFPFSPPVLTGVEVLSVFNLGTPSFKTFKNPGSAPGYCNKTEMCRRFPFKLSVNYVLNYCKREKNILSHHYHCLVSVAIEALPKVADMK